MKDSRKTIVIVDDNKTFVMYGGLLLKRLGFDVIPAESGQDGFTLARVFRPHAVLLDIYMPHVNGIEVIRQLKADPELAGIPIFVVSASNEDDLRQECRELGCDGFLTKPLTLRILQDSLLPRLFPDETSRRKHLRCGFQRKIQLTSEAGRAERYSVTLSEGGIYLRDRKPLPVDSRVTVQLSLDGGETLTLPGRVIYRKDIFHDSFGIEPGMAVAFDELDTRSRSSLYGYVAKQLTADLIEEQDQPVIASDVATPVGG